MAQGVWAIIPQKSPIEQPIINIGQELYDKLLIKRFCLRPTLGTITKISF
jgi:hypothetical protein